MYCCGLTGSLTECTKKAVNGKYCRLHSKMITCITGPETTMECNLYDLIWSSVEFGIGYKNFDMTLNHIPSDITSEIYSYFPDKLVDVMETVHYRLYDDVTVIYDKMFGFSVGTKSKYICHHKDHVYKGVEYSVLYTRGPKRRSFAQIHLTNNVNSIHNTLDIKLFSEFLSLFDSTDSTDSTGYNKVHKRKIHVQGVSFAIELIGLGDDGRVLQTTNCFVNHGYLLIYPENCHPLTLGKSKGLHVHDDFYTWYCQTLIDNAMEGIFDIPLIRYPN